MAIVYPLAAHPDQQERAAGVGPARTTRRSSPALDAETLRQRIFTRTRRPARGRRAAADQEHPRQQVADRRRQPEDAQRRDGGALCASTSSARWRHAQAAPDVATLMQGAWREVYARPGADVAGRRRRGPVRRLRRQRRPPQARAAAPPVGRATGRPARRVRRSRGWRRSCSATARATSPTRSAQQENERWVDHCSARLHEGAGGSTTLSDVLRAHRPAQRGGRRARPGDPRRAVRLRRADRAAAARGRMSARRDARRRRAWPSSAPARSAATTAACSRAPACR